MKIKTHSYLTLSILLLFALLGAVVLKSYYETVDDKGTPTISEGKIEGILNQTVSLLKESDNVDQAKGLIRGFELTIGIKKSSAAEVKSKEIFGHILSVISSKPKEASSRSVLAIKRDALENLINAYRKELPAGSVPLRAAYLNLLFEIQATLPNEDLEEEFTSIKKVRERLAQLKIFGTSSSDAALIQRITAIEAGVTGYEKGINTRRAWVDQRQEAIALIEKNSRSYSADLAALNGGKSADLARKNFMLVSIIYVAFWLLAFVVILVSGKLSSAKLKLRMAEILKMISEFGMAQKSEERIVAEKRLLADGNWSAFVQSISDLEKRHQNRVEKVYSSSQSLALPFFLFDKDLKLQFWNSHVALHVKDVTPGMGLAEIFQQDTFRLRGESASLAKNLVALLHADRDERNFAYELAVKTGNVWSNYELLSFPVADGQFKGGRLLLMREIRNEVLRIEKIVGIQLDRIRDLVNKLAHNRAIEFSVRDDDYLPVRETILDLEAVKLRLDEREILWKSEGDALKEQVERQREILVRLFEEIDRIFSKHLNLSNALTVIHSVDSEFHKEICLFERDLEGWVSARERVLKNIQKQSQLLQLHQDQEADMRKSVADIRTRSAAIESALTDLKKFNEDLTLNAINLSFAGNEKDYAERARACAQSLGTVLEKITQVTQSWDAMVRNHPAGSKMPLSNSFDFDFFALEELQEEQHKLIEFITKWKTDGGTLLESGKQAIELVSTIRQSSSLVHQLGETSLLLNDQARGNLQRWN